MTLKNVRNFIFVVGVVVLLFAISNLTSSTRLDNAVRVVIDLTTLQEVVNSLDQIDEALEEERIAAGQYPLNGDEQMLTRISEAQTQYDEAWAVLMNYRGDEKAEVLANISTARETYKGMLDDVITEYQSNPADNDSANMMSTAITFYLQYLDPALSSFKEPEVQAFLAKSKAEASKASRYLQQSRIIAIVGTGITLFGVAMTFIYAFGMTRIVRSILEIIDTANSISRGDLDIPIDTEKPGEIGELAEAIERMRTSLKAAIERLRR